MVYTTLVSACCVWFCSRVLCSTLVFRGLRNCCQWGYGWCAYLKFRRVWTLSPFFPNKVGRHCSVNVHVPPVAHCLRRTWTVRIVWPDTELNLAEAAELLGNAWQVSQAAALSPACGELNIAPLPRGKRPVGGASSLGTVFCPLLFSCDTCWGSNPEGLFCHPASASQMLGWQAFESQASSVFFFFFFKNFKSSFTPLLHSFAKPLWGSLLETLALISILLLVSWLFFLLNIWQLDFPFKYAKQFS